MSGGSEIQGVTLYDIAFRTGPATFQSSSGLSLQIKFCHRVGASFNFVGQDEFPLFLSELIYFLGVKFRCETVEKEGRRIKTKWRFSVTDRSRIL